jgi:hypothetical protein
MGKKIQCPFCAGFFSQNADGSIHGHGRGDMKYPNCGEPLPPATAQCTTCRQLFVDGDAFDGHRDKGECVHLLLAGYEEKGGVWRRIPGLVI